MSMQARLKEWKESNVAKNVICLTQKAAKKEFSSKTCVCEIILQDLKLRK